MRKFTTLALLALTLGVVVTASASASAQVTSSSGNDIVDSESRSPSDRTAARYSVPRITNWAIATRSESAIASTNSA